MDIAECFFLSTYLNEYIYGGHLVLSSCHTLEREGERESVCVCGGGGGGGAGEVICLFRSSK